MDCLRLDNHVASQPLIRREAFTDASLMLENICQGAASVVVWRVDHKGHLTLPTLVFDTADARDLSALLIECIHSTSRQNLCDPGPLYAQTKALTGCQALDSDLPAKFNTTISRLLRHVTGAGYPIVIAYSTFVLLLPWTSLQLAATVDPMLGLVCLP